MLQQVASRYVFERGKPFARSEFGKFVRHDLAKEAKKQVLFQPIEFRVKASVGNGNWAAVPWLAFFDPLITNTATRGVYVVYLINPQTQDVCLSLNQGTTAVFTEYGKTRGAEVLKRRAVDMADRVHDLHGNFSTKAIDLGSDADLPFGYMSGHALGKVYHLDDLSNSEVVADLQEMLRIYRALVDRGATTPIDAMFEEAGSTDIEETRRYILSQRIERSKDVRRAVLSQSALVCQACGMDPKLDYSFSGKPLKTPLDVHHARPLRSLQEGETRRYKVPDDFMVLCPTCHRMIHKLDDPSDLRALKHVIRFKHLREILYPET